MAIECGIDIIEISRIKRAIEDRGPKFIEKVYTRREIKYCEDKNKGSFQSFAARFAAKEACSKALGYGMGSGIEWKDMEVLNNANEKPSMVLHGNALKRYFDIKGKSISLSLSHCRDYAIAQVIIETD